MRMAQSSTIALPLWRRPSYEAAPRGGRARIALDEIVRDHKRIGWSNAPGSANPNEGEHVYVNSCAEGHHDRHDAVTGEDCVGIKTTDPGARNTEIPFPEKSASVSTGKNKLRHP
jgi:hypothetical protein